ncbi:MAG: hypothetical protein KME20_03955 [Kaiparowitsia implicata GSE-PSE-MK54-09C]|jgi:hypothetical protein|nr:hypothetical protein [Kaiparowitsia implicata GSE-PSE-MK54-09C]
MQFIKGIPDKNKFESCLIENQLPLLNHLLGAKIQLVRKALEVRPKNLGGRNLFLHESGSFIVNTDIITFEIATSVYFNSLILQKLDSNELLVSDSRNKMITAIIDGAGCFLDDIYLQRICEVKLIKIPQHYSLYQGKPNNIGLIFEFENGKHVIFGHHLDRHFSSVGAFQYKDIQEEILPNIVFESLE